MHYVTWLTPCWLRWCLKNIKERTYLWEDILVVIPWIQYLKERKVFGIKKKMATCWPPKDHKIGKINKPNKQTIIFLWHGGILMRIWEFFEKTGLPLQFSYKSGTNTLDVDAHYLLGWDKGTFCYIFFSVRYGVRWCIVYITISII